MKKRLFPLLIAILMAFAMMPFSVVPAYADDPAPITIDGVVYTPNADGTTATVTGYNSSELPSEVMIPKSITHNEQSYTVTSIGSSAFMRCQVDSIELPDSIKSIDNNAFMWCEVESVTLPNNLTSIGVKAFNYCTLKSITIPASVTSIGSAAFEGSGLTSVVFEDGSAITTFPSSLFSGCKNMKSITLPEKLTSIEYRALNGLESLESITFPETLTTIGEYALRNCSKITTIAIPASVTSIGKDAFENVPLNTVYFDGSKAQWDAVTGDGKPTNVTVVYGAFTVTFLDGQGKTLKTETVKKGEDATAPSAPTRDGYTFNGWDKEFSNVTQDLTVTAQWKKSPSSPEPKPTPAKVSGTLIAKITAKGKTGLTIGWNKVNGADGYDIFFARCDHDRKKVACKNAKTIKGNDTFKWTKSGLRKGTPYKAYVKAYVMQNGKKKYVKTSPVMHAYTGNGTKRFTNAKSVSVSKTNVSLKKGKTFKIKATVKKANKGKKLMPTTHAPSLRYMTSNGSVATVSKSGKITAKGKGSCDIYVYAHNGVYKKIKVIVK